MSFVDVRRDGAVVVISLNRPAKLNALSTAMLEDLTEAVRRHDGPPAERMLVFEGRGERAFCAGSDLADVQAGESALARHEAALSGLIGALSSAAAMKVALLHGQVRGGGTVFPSLVDLVLAADDLQLSLPEIHFGMYQVVLHALLLEKLPEALVWQLAATGRVLGARESLELGIAAEVLPADDFRLGAGERVRFYADRLGALALGRRMRSISSGAGVPERVAAAVPLMMQNHSLPGVKDRIERYAQAIAAKNPAKRGTGGDGS